MVFGFCEGDDRDSDFESAVDHGASQLSYIGNAAYEWLSEHHQSTHHKAWNVTSGKAVGEVLQTPHGQISWPSTTDPADGHDDWFPKKFFALMSQTQIWCDVTSLGPPDGQFMEQFQEALRAIAQNAKGKEKPITVRMLFGNIVGMPVNCHSVIHELVDDVLPDDANIELWVGAWRKGVSWNHSKIIAVDGKHLITGGHNLWTQHYLKKEPVHDITMQLEGRVAQDGHLYANAQWQYIEDQQETLLGRIVNQLPDNLPMVLPSRVTVSEWPEGKAKTYPPQYNRSKVPVVGKSPEDIPMISMGRFGAIMPPHASDDAFVAMFDAARSSIRMALQDLGPITLPGVPGPVAVPGTGWPKPYLEAFGRAIWERNVKVEIALSNPNSIPDGLSPTEACYGNGWSCADVAAELIKTIPDNFEDVDEAELRIKIEKNLSVCFIKEAKGSKWDSEMTMGMHAKHFIVDDRCYYVGSQNLYVCDLAEWGVVIDDPAQTKKCMQEYWNPLWKASHTHDDFLNSSKVFDALDVDRDGKNPLFADHKTKKLAKDAKRAQYKCSHDSKHHDDAPHEISHHD